MSCVLNEIVSQLLTKAPSHLTKAAMNQFLVSSGRRKEAGWRDGRHGKDSGVSVSFGKYTVEISNQKLMKIILTSKNWKCLKMIGDIRKQIQNFHLFCKVVSNFCDPTDVCERDEAE